MSQDNTQYDFSGSASTVINQNSLPIETLIEMAENIFRTIKSENLGDSEKVFYSYFDRYKDFSRMFPVVLRCMVQFKKFNKKAFKKYLIKFKDINHSDRSEFVAIQADYMMYLYQAEHPHVGQKELYNYKQCVLNELIEENKKNEELYEKELEAQIELSKKRDAEKRKQLKEYFLKQKELNKIL